MWVFFSKGCVWERKVFTAAMEEQDIKTSHKEYLCWKNTLMYRNPGRSLPSCELVEGHDHDKTGSIDFVHGLRIVVGPYLFEEANFRGESAGGVITYHRIPGSWRHTEFGMD